MQALLNIRQCQRRGSRTGKLPAGRQSVIEQMVPQAAAEAATMAEVNFPAWGLLKRNLLPCGPVDRTQLDTFQQNPYCYGT